MIPTAYATGIDMVSNDNLAIDDSNGNLELEELSIEGSDSSSDKSQAIMELGIEEDKKSISQDELLEDSDYDPELDFDDDEEDDSDLEEDEKSDDDYDDDKFYNDLVNSMLKENLGNKTIVGPYTFFDPRLHIDALFVDKNMKPLKNTAVIFKVNGNRFRLKTDSYGFASAIIDFNRYKLKYFYITLINPVTGEKYTFPEIYFNISDPANYAYNYTEGFELNGNVHYFTINSNGLKSTIKTNKSIVSKTITYSKGNVILSTKSNKANSSSSSEESTEQLVIDRFTRYLIYLIGLLCIVVPIGILRYRKKG